MSKLDLIQNTTLEMRRGTLVLAVLTQLDTAQYGYSLVQSLAEHDLIIDTNTLYPLLRRLEKQELLLSEWEIEGNRPRRYYRISALGIAVREALKEEWQQLSTIMSKLLEG